jgi:hypothetical protein
MEVSLDLKNDFPLMLAKKEYQNIYFVTYGSSVQTKYEKMCKKCALKHTTRDKQFTHMKKVHHVSAVIWEELIYHFILELNKYI